VLQYCVLFNGAQWYEQFSHIGLLNQALILLGLAPYLLSASASTVFMVLYTLKYFFYIIYLTF